MKIALVFPTFSKNMGYMGNMLPKYLARQGVEVHVVAMDLPHNYYMKDFKETYKNFDSANPLLAGTVEEYDGYTLHILPHRQRFGQIQMVGLWEKLRFLRPDIVQTFNAIGSIPLDVALAKPFIDYKLFTGNHTTASVFPLANYHNYSSFLSKEKIINTLVRFIPGRVVSFFTEKCYAATIDCGDVAVRFFGVPQNKIEILNLGVDTEIFKPATLEEEKQKSQKLRQKFNFLSNEIVCVYAGKFSEDKNPLLLANAISHLIDQGEPFRGLFIGNGVQGEAIQSCKGCIVHPFVPVHELGNFFRCANIGVWPTQESTCMIDAAACGLPIVVNDTLAAVERIEGNGLTYKLNDLMHLIQVLLSLRDSEIRQKLGSFGAIKMARDFSWETLAKRRINDYQIALNNQ